MCGIIAQILADTSDVAARDLHEALYLLQRESRLPVTWGEPF